MIANPRRGRSGLLQVPEVSPGAVHIFPDLLAQLFHAGELLLIAQAVEETKLDFRLRGQRDGMEIEQVALDGEGILAERRAYSDVSDRVEDFSADASPRDVHAILRHQFVIAAQVDGRDCVLMAVTATAARG